MTTSFAKASLDEVADVIPAIRRIETEELRDACRVTWCLSWERSSYDSLLDMAWGPGPVGHLRLMDHVNQVNDHLEDVITSAASVYGVRVDHDIALAAAILHDVDKPLLWGPQASLRGEVGFHEGRSLKDHGLMGADIAREAGVPEAVARIVMGHSQYSPLCEERRSPEAVALLQADGMSSAFGFLAAGLVPSIGKTMLVKVAS